MPEYRAIRPVLAVTVMVAASMLVPGARGEPPTLDSSPPIERQYKGQLDPIGPFSWLDLDGHRWTDRDFRGKVLIVQQWAAWCGPCVAEFPEVQKLFNAVHHDPSMAFVSLNMDRDPKAIQEFLRDFRREYSFPVLFAGAQLKILSVPRTWIVDRDGYIREVLRNVGSDLVEQALASCEAVKRRVPVAALPPETVQERRRLNEQDGANSR